MTYGKLEAVEITQSMVAHLINQLPAAVQSMAGRPVSQTSKLSTDLTNEEEFLHRLHLKIRINILRRLSYIHVILYSSFRIFSHKRLSDSDIMSSTRNIFQSKFPARSPLSFPTGNIPCGQIRAQCYHHIVNS